MVFKARKAFVVRFILTLVLLSGVLGVTQVLAEPDVSTPLYLSLANGKTIGGVASADEDILRFDGQSWSLFFDGSDVGVAASDLFAFSIVDEDTLLMSFSSPVFVNGILAAPQDALRFDATSLGSTTAGIFRLYFDGSDAGFDTTAESIDALSLLSDGRLLISTTGNPSVPGVSGRDEDVLAFAPTSLGDITSGTWSMYFDGSDVGLGETSAEDVDALDVVDEQIYLSTLGNFSVSGLSGADEDVFVCAASSLGSLTACDYSPALYFDGSAWALESNDVDAFHFLDPQMIPTPTFTPWGPTETLTPYHTPTHTVTATEPTATFTPYSTPTHTVTATEPTVTFTPYSTATHTVTATEPTATTTSLPGCSSIRDSVGPLVVRFVDAPAPAVDYGVMYLDIPNATAAPIAVSSIRVGWNYEDGHYGKNHTLRLRSAQLNGTAFWAGDEYLPVFQIPLSPDALTLPANGTSRITFTFDQTYDRLANENLFITFSTPGCEPYPIDVTVAVEE